MEAEGIISDGGGTGGAGGEGKDAEANSAVLFLSARSLAWARPVRSRGRTSRPLLCGGGTQAPPRGNAARDVARELQGARGPAGEIGGGAGGEEGGASPRANWHL
jgi:hypothetical protein